MKRLFGFALFALCVGAPLVGCGDGGKPAIDPNEVELVPEEQMEKARQQAMQKMNEMSGQNRYTDPNKSN